MKKLFSSVCFLLSTIALCAQSDVSAPMSFHIEKELVPPILNIVPNTVRLVDPSNNGVIDGGETCKFCFEVENSGRGDAYGCTAHVIASGTKEGLIIRDISLPVIPSGSKKLIEVPIEASEHTQTGEVSLTIKVNEPNGYGTDDIRYSIGTHRMRTPYVEIASYKVVGAKGGKLNRREIFKLQVIVQNTDQGIAEDVMVSLQRPANVSWMGGTSEHMSIGTLRPNETRVLEYELSANQLADDQINIHLDLGERSGKYAKNADIPLQFGQYIGSTIAMNVERHDEEVTIRKASLVSDVDKDIPQTSVKNPNTFALIIANEHYQNVAAVPFALNDGSIFREYCLKTLGVPERNIQYVTDATGNNLKSEINTLRDLIEASKGNAKVIFYYAGHGVPDDKKGNGNAYLLPVDGVGSDYTTGYKLDDLYASLGQYPSQGITVLLDACFSGGTRVENQTLDPSARGVAIKVRRGQPVGQMVVFSAAQDDQTANPEPSQQHGMFTYYLLKKLQETKGEVSLKDLSEYVIDNVTLESVRNKHKQQPCLTPSAEVASEWQNWKLK